MSSNPPFEGSHWWSFHSSLELLWSDSLVQSASLEDFPQELLLLISKQLTLDTLCNLSSTSKRWYRLGQQLEGFFPVIPNSKLSNRKYSKYVKIFQKEVFYYGKGKTKMVAWALENARSLILEAVKKAPNQQKRPRLAEV